MSSDEFRQASIVQFLSDPASHDGLPVERISTHAAHIFLAGNYAYKLKRAVDLSFLDFSTSDKRRAMLEAELRLNKPVAPTLYLEVRPIYDDGAGHVGFRGSGKPADWVLVMRRFPQDALLDNIAQRGALTESMIDILADAIVDMHRRAPAAREQISDAFRKMALDNLKVFQAASAGQTTVSGVDRDLRKQLDAVASHFDRRAREGFVKRCHADLHLGNIVLLDGKPTPFDALEFDESLATVDVYYDLAFALMDLERRGLRLLANRLLNRYVARTGDIDGLRALHIFMAVRALIRAKVATISSAQSKQPNMPISATSYLDLATRLLKGTLPRLVGIGGLSGTGKSALGVRLAPMLEPAPGALLMRSDILRKQLAGVGETTRLPQQSYTAEFSTRVYDHLLGDARQALAFGMSVVVDAVFSKPDERRSIEDLARSVGVPFLGIWLEASLPVRTARVSTRKHDASDADAAVVVSQSRYETGNVTWHKCNAGGTYEETLQQAMAALSTRAGN